MHDLGFEPRRVSAGELPAEITQNARAGVEFGWRQRNLRLLILASAVQTGFFSWAFYASQPYLLELLDSDAIWISGLVAAGIALSTIAGNQLVTVASRYCGRRTTSARGCSRRGDDCRDRRRPGDLVLVRARGAPARDGVHGSHEPGAIGVPAPGRPDPSSVRPSSRSTRWSRAPEASAVSSVSARSARRAPSGPRSSSEGWRRLRRCRCSGGCVVSGVRPT